MTAVRKRHDAAFKKKVALEAINCKHRVCGAYSEKTPLFEIHLYCGNKRLEY